VLGILRTHPTSIAWWYTGAWGITAAGLAGEMAYASGLIDPWPRSFFNSQVSALASALVMAIALAARMREEKLARVAAQGNAMNALHRFRETYNSMPVGMFSMRLDGTIVEYNPAFGAMFNLDPPSQYRTPTTWAEVANEHAYESLVDQSEGGRITDTEIAIPSRGGRRWLHMRAMRKSNQIETWIEDITARKEAEGRLQFLADHDSLTGLLNRRGFNAHLERAITASKTRVVCFAYIDLDRFKLVNDLFGHVAGDQILRQLATRTRELIRPPHLTARVGGDEFILIIYDLELDAARELCEDLRRALSDRPYQHQDKAFSVAASIGLIRLGPDMSPRDALTAADRSCSEAKRSGGATVIALDSSSSELTSYLDEIKLVANMRERPPVENFFTQLQPIVSLRNPYSSLCYEVLVRMRDRASGTAIPPGRFIAAAERNGLMGQIDRWVLRSTLEWLDQHSEHRDSLGFCTVNLSGASLNDEKFLQDTIALIRNHSDATKKICFEITESVALYDLNTTRRFVDKVKTFGARVALDDFGAGYTSFNYLKELPGDLVKIDGSFIRDVNLNPANYAITRALVELTHEIGMACVAEWAENAEIVHSLVDLGVDYAQGYGLCRPVDRERLLHVNHGVALVQDEKVVALLREQRSPTPSLRTGPGGRRRVLSS
ncbi:MAG: putative bifunctional diguanylate cyclase/phosphodiesterase, partial [Gammaproteobacteria bacterium]